MLVLVATRRTQGEWAADVDGCILGELVCWGPASVTHDELRGGDRAFHGLNSDRSTTTAEVVELPEFAPADYLLAVQSNFARHGLHPAAAGREFRRLTALLSGLSTGTVVRRRGHDILVAVRP